MANCPYSGFVNASGTSRRRRSAAPADGSSLGDDLAPPGSASGIIAKTRSISVSGGSRSWPSPARVVSGARHECGDEADTQPGHIQRHDVDEHGESEPNADAEEAREGPHQRRGRIPLR